MHALSPEQILNVWELGRRQHALDRALTLLAIAEPGVSRDELAELPIGERDARLLRLRRVTLGPTLSGSDACPNCGERVEFQIDTAELEQPPEQSPAVLELNQNGCCMYYRLPSSRDLAEAAAATNTAEGIRRLLTRCVLETRGNGTPVTNAALEGNAPVELSPELIAVLGEAMAAADPQAEITFALKCPRCAQSWQALFDIVAFFWKEIEASARRLLLEIDAIARNYGWSERDILSLSAARRHTYLELIGA